MNEAETISDNKVPSSLTQIGITMKYTFLDYFRSRRFFILLIITLIISATLTVFVGYTRSQSFLGDPLTFYYSWWGTSANIVIILGGIFFGGDAISGEFQNKTGYFGIPNPIRRSSVYIGKWLSAFIAATIIFAIFAIITVGNGLYYFGTNIPIQFGQSLLYAWFYLAAVMGLTFFFSSLFKSSSMSILVTVLLFLFVFSLLETLVSTLANVEPWFILTYGAGIIGNILAPGGYPAHIQHSPPIGRARFTLTSYYAYVPEGLAIIGLYFIITAILGLILFERKEFT
jgi:ABC-2 type transport system permease protein